MRMTFSKRVKITAVVATLTAVLTVGISLWAFILSRTDRTEDHRKQLVDQLLHSHNDDHFSAAMSETLLREMAKIIEQESGGDETKRRLLRLQFARSLATFFQGTDVDFERSGNLEFDLVCLRDWKEYAQLLGSDSGANANITYRYFIALSNLRKKEPDFVSGAKVLSDGRTIST